MRAGAVDKVEYLSEKNPGNDRKEGSEDPDEEGAEVSDRVVCSDRV